MVFAGPLTSTIWVAPVGFDSVGGLTRFTWAKATSGKSTNIIDSITRMAISASGGRARPRYMDPRTAYRAFLTGLGGAPGRYSSMMWLTAAIGRPGCEYVAAPSMRS